ncbi:MAG: hypothetical protein ACRDG8_08185 [Actinomycetota bacterium]
MEIQATPDAKKLIRARGGMVFVWVEAGMRGLRFLRTSTEPPPDALDWVRSESHEGFIVFTPPWMRKPRMLGLEVRGFLTKLRINALWNGCAFVV